MSLLEHPDAQALLDEATVSARQVRSLSERLDTFLRRYLPLFHRREQRDHATLVVRGKLGGLERKTSEPIANEAGVHRKPVQSFVGWGKWDDEAVTAELHRHVAQEWGDDQAVLTVDPSAFPKKGTESCGVGRQYCGRLGKVENCQVGLFVGYACRHGHTLLDRRLFLPEEWATDPERREKGHLPKTVKYQERWQIALDLLDRLRTVPHRWITADTELGRCSEFRAALRQRHEGYLLEVPANTSIRELNVPAPRRRGQRGRLRKPPWVRVDTWAKAQPAERWERFVVREGTKEPLEVEVLTALVQTRHRNRVGPQERVVVLRSRGAEPRVWHKLSNASRTVPTAELVRAHGEHHSVEQGFQEGKGEVGLGQYEVRSWVGWHHHMTLSLLALWFLALERCLLGGKNPGADGVATAADHDTVAAPASPQRGADRGRHHPCAAA